MSLVILPLLLRNSDLKQTIFIVTYFSTLDGKGELGQSLSPQIQLYTTPLTPCPVFWYLWYGPIELYYSELRKWLLPSWLLTSYSISRTADLFQRKTASTMPPCAVRKGHQHWWRMFWGLILLYRTKRDRFLLNISSAYDLHLGKSEPWPHGVHKRIPHELFM